ncbi:hypothetical protein VP01_3930g1 [Puccinia sorghi]|uniref:Uncharacterized protein n=1 Tax=Puccinia sorghi TaxID=27349 RepID=A0A0L6UTC9_9BASI|nr:hypothetical protein VP01_3930g1 [Puccinia sorghi]
MTDPRVGTDCCMILGVFCSVFHLSFCPSKIENVEYLLIQWELAMLMLNGAVAAYFRSGFDLALCLINHKLMSATSAASLKANEATELQEKKHLAKLTAEMDIDAIPKEKTLTEEIWSIVSKEIHNAVKHTIEKPSISLLTESQHDSFNPAVINLPAQTFPTKGIEDCNPIVGEAAQVPKYANWVQEKAEPKSRKRKRKRLSNQTLECWKRDVNYIVSFKKNLPSLIQISLPFSFLLLLSCDMVVDELIAVEPPWSLHKNTAAAIVLQHSMLQNTRKLNENTYLQTLHMEGSTVLHKTLHINETKLSPVSNGLLLSTPPDFDIRWLETYPTGFFLLSRYERTCFMFIHSSAYWIETQITNNSIQNPFLIPVEKLVLTLLSLNSKFCLKPPYKTTEQLNYNCGRTSPAWYIYESFFQTNLRMMNSLLSSISNPIDPWTFLNTIRI